MQKSPIKCILVLLLAIMAGCSSAPKQDQTLQNEPEFKVSSKVLPEAALNLYNSAISAMKDGNLKLAQESLLTLEQTVKDAPGIYANLGVIAEKNNDIAVAKQYYEKTLDIDAYNITALNNLANMRVKEGDFQGAKTFYSRALRADEKNQVTLINLASLSELYLHDLDFALNLYKKYVDFYPENKKEVAGRISDLERRVD